MLTADLFWKLVRFGVVGVTVMGVFMGLNWLLAPILGRQAAFLVAYLPSVGLHFCLNKFWTFGCERADSGRQISEYIVMVVVTFFIQWSVFTALGAWTSLPSWINAGLANITQMAVSFLMMQRRVFAPRGAPKNSVLFKGPIFGYNPPEHVNISLRKDLDFISIQFGPGIPRGRE